MQKTSRLSSTVLVIGSLLTGLGPLAPAPVAYAQGEDSPTARAATRRVEEIVVRARKRDEFLQDTPVAVTAIGGPALDRSSVTQLDQIRALVPNLHFDVRRNYEADARIRGVGSADGQIAFDSGVGIYVDGVFLPRSFGGIADVLDIQQIEVLRGPQGTLFGKNTVGGAINISTVKPHEEFEGSVSLRVGNFDSVNTRLMLNVPIDFGPLEDRLFTRFAFSSQNNEGYTRNTFRNERWGDKNNLAFLGSIRFLPTEDITIDVSGSWSRLHAQTRGGQCRVVAPGGLGTLVDGFTDACNASRPFVHEADEANLVDVRSYGAWAVVRWDLGDLGPVSDLSFKSTSSWREQLPRRRDDLDMTRFPLIKLSNVGGSESDAAPGFQEQFSQELQVNGTAFERLTFVTGAFAFWEVAESRSATRVLPDVLNVLNDDLDRVDNWNWAIYGQATLDVTDWLSITGGLRYTEEKKGIFIDNLVAGDDGGGQLVPTRGGDSRIFTAWTPMGSIALTAPEELLDGTPLSQLLAYFTYSRGFKGGGFNAILASSNLDPFRPEFLDSFELGFKTTALDERLIVNVALFHAKYDDIQVNSLRDAGDPDGDGVPNLEALTLNAAKATNEGFEVEVLAIPMEGLTIQGNVGVLDARYDEFLGLSDITGQGIDRSGQRFFEVPSVDSFLAVQYELPVDGEGYPWPTGWLTPRVEWKYTGSVIFTGPELPEGRQPSIHLLNARLTYRFWDDRAEVALWARNLTDETYFNYVTGLASSFGIAVRYFDWPRTFGAQLTYKF